MRLGPDSAPSQSPPTQALCDRSGPETADGLRVLIVCTANQCRSPMAEFLLRRALGDRGLHWQVSSAGTRARPGLQMYRDTQKVLGSYGIGVGDWYSRRVEPWMLDTSDLVLTATREHRSAIVAARPDVLGRTFPILQFVRLAGAARRAGRWTPADADPASLLTAVRAVQGDIQVPPQDTDLGDPFGHRYRRFRLCADTIEHAIEELLEL